MMRWIGLLVVAVALAIPSEGLSALITFTHTGTGSGDIGGTGFTDAAFTITAAGNTANRLSYTNGFFIDHDSSSIAIAGVGTFSFITGTRTFVSNVSSTVGFSRAGTLGADLYNGPTDVVFATWDMLTSLGPIPGFGGLLQWNSSPVNTSGGVLVFEDRAGIAATFQAVVQQEPPEVIPEPASAVIWTLLAAVVGVALARRRKTA